MNKIYRLLLILIITVFAVSCNKEDSPNIAPPRDYAEQFATDDATINDFLDEYYMEVSPDFEVTFTKIPEGGTQESIREQDMYVLRDSVVHHDIHNIDYKYYYISFQEGTSKSTTAVDSVYVSYKGKYLYHQSDLVTAATPTTPAVYEDNIYDKQFDYAQNPLWFRLDGVIKGWQEVIPLFKTGTYDPNDNGPNPVTFTGYGAGVMFLPSGLGYYNGGQANLPAYSPLVFSFKLKNQRSRDHDGDGVLSKYEVDPLVADQKPADYDSDGDGVANLYDADDDGDFYYTRDEIKKPTPLLPGQGSSALYPFDPIADDPSTPGIDETEPKGIPSKDIINIGTGEPDGTTATRLRRHLDPAAKPPYTVY